jgi:casein kinase 1
LPIIEFGISNTERFIIYNYIEYTIYKRILSKDEIYHLGHSMISIIEYIHKKGIIHCDISAKNILYDSNNNNFYLNDFGHSKHITFCINEKGANSMVGCPLFCSEYIHLGYEYAPRDDFISLAYVLIYSIKNMLPWSGKKDLTSVYESKKNLRTNILKYSFIPYEIKIFCNYCFHLKLNEKPNYSILKKLFTSSNIEIPIHT